MQSPGAALLSRGFCCGKNGKETEWNRKTAWEAWREQTADAPSLYPHGIAALLAAEGVSMMGIAMAKTIFHVTSLAEEIPSGILSDVWSRKKTLLISRLFFVLAALAMMAAGTKMPLIFLSMAFTALGYNFASGTRETLACDSLRLNDREQDFSRLLSADTIVYRVGQSAATLLAGAALFLGSFRAVGADAAVGTAAVLCALFLRDIPADAGRLKDPVLARIFAVVRKSLHFLFQEHRAVGIMLGGGAVCALGVLSQYFLQARLLHVGVPETVLGPLLFVCVLGGALVFLKMPALMCLGAFLANFCSNGNA